MTELHGITFYSHTMKVKHCMHCASGLTRAGGCVCYIYANIALLKFSIAKHTQGLHPAGMYIIAQCGSACWSLPYRKSFRKSEARLAERGSC